MNKLWMRVSSWFYQRQPMWYYNWRSRKMSSCRVCHSTVNVLAYDPRGIWAYFFRNTYCPEHCPDHIYSYHPSEGSTCDNCSQERPQEDYDDY